MLISFIVPVYNRDKLIHECLHSLLDHPWKDYEVILVDDASTDDSAAVCDQYAKDFPNIHTIHLAENSGPGYARNCGMEIAQGEWLFFLDSDDLICTKNLDNIIPQIENMPQSVDLIAVDIIDEWDGVRWDYPFFDCSKIMDATAYIKRYPMRIHMPLWNYLFRRNYLQKKHLYLPEQYLHEDVTFLLDVFREVREIGCLAGYFYCYRRETFNQSLTAVLHNAYPMEPYQIYISKLCADIQTWAKHGDDIRKDAYMQVLAQCAYNVIYVLPTKPYKHLFTAHSIDPITVGEIGVEQFLEDLFFEALTQYDGKQCYLAPANKVSRIGADYFTLYGCNVVGIVDNYAKAVETPLGTLIPVCTRENAKMVCGDIPILLTSCSHLGAKLDKYFREQGLTILPWTLKRDAE